MSRSRRMGLVPTRGMGRRIIVQRLRGTASPPTIVPRSRRLQSCWHVARTTDAANAGEAFVTGRLQRDGYRILDRNWRVRGGELDIVALDGEILVFVEVKVRTDGRVSVA